MGLEDKTDIYELKNRANNIIVWLGENVFHPDFYERASELAILRIKIFNYYNSNNGYKNHH